MKEGQLLIVFPLAADPVPPWGIVIALVIAIAIIVAAVFLIRSGKKKGADTTTSPGDWPQQQGGWNQSQPSTGWNQQPQQGNNPWGTQPPTATWGNQQQQQQQQQQPMAATNAWGSPQPATNTNPWATQPPQQPPTAAANPWVTQPPQQPPTNTNPWANQPPQQPPTAAANPWAAPQPLQQSAAPANPWATQQQPQPTTNQWGNQAPTVAAQEPWNQQQQGTPSFGNTTPPQNLSQPIQQDSWGASNPAQPNQFPANNNPALSSWQQQPNIGAPATTGGFGGQNTTGGFGQNDIDKTILRPGGTPNATSGMGYVRVEEGKEPGRIYEVRKEALSIGRSRESDIFLEDLAVSRLHASIVNLGNNSYALKDEGSANGTKVNGQLVNKFQTYPLQEGDRIQLGQTVLVFARH